MQLFCQRSFCELLMCAPLNSICNSEMSEFASSVVEKKQAVEVFPLFQKRCTWVLYLSNCLLIPVESCQTAPPVSELHSQVLVSLCRTSAELNTYF